MKLSRILETALYAENLTETADFYERLLGIPRLSEDPGRDVFFQLDGQMLLLFNPQQTQIASTNPAYPIPIHGAQGQGHICFEIEPGTVEIWRARLAELGIALEQKLKWPTKPAISLYFRDPAGNSVELVERSLWF